KYEESLNYYMKANQIKPKNAGILLGLGQVCVSLNNYEESLNYYRKANQIEPQNVDILLCLGQT
ncbi:16015_t:CDS:2, partial [Acaulospora morrowiae]